MRSEEKKRLVINLMIGFFKIEREIFFSIFNLQTLNKVT